MYEGITRVCLYARYSSHNLTDLKNKTYHLSPDGTSTQSDSVCNAPVLNPNPIVISQFVLHEVSCFL